jgi:peptidyl-prolyl cis-trans isomerase B (cyclophilin B)
MAARAEAAHRRRQRGAIAGAVVAAVLVIGAVVWVVTAVTGGKKSTPSAAASSSAAAHCTWSPSPNPSASPSQAANPNLKNVGTPPASGEPRSGTRDMTINTNLGNVVVQLDVAKAPCTSESFTYLAGKQFFDNTSCHRLVSQSGTDQQSGTATEFHVLQCGDPTGTGMGGPSYTFADENLPANQRPTYPQGVVAMANGGANTNGSQFFFVFADTTLPANYTIFGKVTQGLDIVKKVGQGGDDGAFASQAGGGHPKTKLSFTKVTVGPVQTGRS